MDAHLIARRRLEAGVISAMEQSLASRMKWGADDCAMWAADIIRDALGYDPARRFRSGYRSRAGAMRTLGPRGLRGALKLAARRHGWEAISPQLAQAGDIGLAWTQVEIPGRRGKPSCVVPVLATVICRGPGWFVGRKEDGFTGLAADQVVYAWSVLPLPAPTGFRLGCPVPAPCGPRMPQVTLEPVSTFIGLSALIFNAGLATSVGAASLIGGFIVSSTISVGLSFASAALSHRGAGPLTDTSIAPDSSLSSQQISTRQSAPPKRIPYGTCFIGGALFFEKVKPPYLYRGFVISSRKIAGLRALYIGNTRLQFAGMTPGQILTPLGVVGQANYAGRLQMSFRNGEPDQAMDPLLARDFPELDPSFRQQGLATVVVRYHYGADQDEHTALWGASGQGNTYFLVDGVHVYDPRDPTQLVDDETTWKFTRNATLNQTDYLRADYGGKIAQSKIAWDKIRESADFDDQLVYCKDGTYILRYTLDGLVTLDQVPYDILKKMLTANRATIAQGGGKVWVSSAKPRMPAATLYDDILVGGLTCRNEKLKRDSVNIVQTRFIADEREYNLADGPILRREDLIVSDGEELVATLELPFTRDYRRVERLQKAFLESSRLGKVVSMPIDIRVLAEAERQMIAEPVTVDSTLFAPANGGALVNSLSYVADFTALQFDMSEYCPEIEVDWVADRDEVDFTVAPLNVN